MGIKFRDFCVLEKIIHRKQKIYMVHTLFLTNSQNFNPAKYMAYTVIMYTVTIILYTCTNSAT